MAGIFLLDWWELFAHQGVLTLRVRQPVTAGIRMA